MHLRLPVCLAAALLFAAPARAVDSAAQARELFQKGSQALAARKSKEAIEIFEQAYRAGNSPSLLFYLGEAYRQAGNNAKAIEEYQLYLEKMPTGPKRAEAETYVAELKKVPAPAAPAAPADAAAAASAKRKVSLDDMDLAAAPAAAPAPAKAKGEKKMELDDLDLAEKKPEKKHHRESKSADATPAAATPAAAAPAPATKVAVEEKKSAAPAAKVLVEEKKIAAPAPAAETKAVVKEEQSAAVAPAPVPKIVVEEKKSAPPPPTVIVEEKKSAPPPTAIVVAAVPPLGPLVATTSPATVAAPPSAPVASAVVAPPPAATPVPARVPAPAIIDHSAPAHSSGKAMRNAGIIIGTIGVAALAAGGLWGLGAQSASNELTADAQSGAAYNPDLQTRGKRDQTLEIGFLAGGGAALIGGTLLFALSPSQSGQAATNDDASANRLSLDYASVAPVPGGVSAAAGVRF